MLKCGLNNYGDFVGEVLVYDLKEKSDTTRLVSEGSWSCWTPKVLT